MRPFTPLLLAAVLATPAIARADWLDLTDGTWDVALTCAGGSLGCPPPFHVSITIAGDGVTAMSTTYNGQSFSGDPVDSTSTIDGYTAQRSSLIDDPYSFFYLANDVNEPNPLGYSDHWWVYCSNVADNTCTPSAAGNWTATQVSAVPEPSSWALMVAGLSSLAAVRRRRVWMSLSQTHGGERA